MEDEQLKPPYVWHCFEIILFIAHGVKMKTKGEKFMRIQKLYQIFCPFFLLIFSYLFGFITFSSLIEWILFSLSAFWSKPLDEHLCRFYHWIIEICSLFFQLLLFHLLVCPSTNCHSELEMRNTLTFLHYSSKASQRPSVLRYSSSPRDHCWLGQGWIGSEAKLPALCLKNSSDRSRKLWPSGHVMCLSVPQRHGSTK